MFYLLTKIMKGGVSRIKDLTGERFGKLVVIAQCEKYKDKILWKCLCDCGNETTATTNDLKSGHKKSCGCLKNRSNAKDLIGQRFGRLTVIKRAGTEGSRAVWRCKCDCGKYKSVKSIDLLSGNTKSCGCWKKHRALFDERK